MTIFSRLGGIIFVDLQECAPVFVICLLISTCIFAGI